MPAGFGRPEEIATPVKWMANPAAGFLAGTDILMDGGMVAVLRRSKMQREDPQDASRQASSCH